MSITSQAAARGTSSHERLAAQDQPPTDVVQLKHPLRIASAGLVIFTAVAGGYSVVTNENFQWDRVAFYAFNPQILAGLRSTLILTVAAVTMGLVLGIILATFRISQNRVLSGVAGLYLWFFRGTPLLIQLIFWFNFAALYPRLGISIPFGGPELVGASTNDVLTVWFVALLGLTLNEAAYMAEIIRGGLLAVPKQQTEAAQALGMSQLLLFRRVVLPQALRVIIPPTGNQVIGMLKYSSLVSIIALPDLLYSAQLIYSQNFETIPLLIVVSLWYLLCTSILTVIQRRVEKYYGRGTASAPTPKAAKAIRKEKARLSEVPA
ncbi:amino acid ABC transporter permease [Aeromicrobium sp. Root472D3]|uniref:amino acid ABC transporter permease n=1 Tax=Aeromicrobium sp. Root472D3 TaxID=1736540 RepID=UPI0009E7B506|nr:amino acid ABC transporter permease [Aeromicrobium sp. Root472D3]